MNFADNHIETTYHVHVLTEEATNTSYLILMPEPAIASQASESAIIKVGNPTPAALEERNLMSMEGSAMSKKSETVSFMESLKGAQKSQKKTNNINTKSLHELMDSILNMNIAAKVDKSFERNTIKMLLEQKYTDLPANLD